MLGEVASRNEAYKFQSSTHCKFKEYNVRGYMFVRIHPKYFLKNFFKKLHDPSFGPFFNYKKN